jgi:maleylacetoacetate isomerase
LSHLTLYSYWRSSSSWRVRWALAHKGISYSLKEVNLLAEDQLAPGYLKYSPTGTVPCLVLPNGNAYGESLPILEWLEETYPTPPLLPQDPESRLAVRQLAHVIISQIQPLQNLSVLKKLTQDGLASRDWARHWIQKGLGAFEALLEGKNCSGTYCFGGELTWADLCLVPQCYNARRFDVDLELFPRIRGIEGRCLKLPSCQSAFPRDPKIQP